MGGAAGPVRVADLARALGCEWEGDGDVALTGVSDLASAASGDLCFVRSEAYAEAARASEGSAFIAPAGVDLGGTAAVIRSATPGLAFARAVPQLVQPPSVAAGVHPMAFVDEHASVDPSASIGPGCVVAAGASVGARSVLHANVAIYPGSSIGEGCVLHAGVVVREGCSLGDRVLLQPGVAVGGDGFGYVSDEQGRPFKVPQVGTVVIEDDVEIGANSAIDRATLGETRIRRGAMIDDLVMIGHNCEIGEDAFVVAQSGLSGSTVVGRGAMLMARMGSTGHLRIGDRAFVGAGTGLRHDVPDGGRVFGIPALEERRWHRVMAALPRLPDMLRRLRAIERQLSSGRPDEE